jgi:LSD1 subclass zinc finger protein
MGQVFNCTSCGASLEYAGGTEHTIRCQYCGTNVPVPEEFWQAVEAKQTMNKWGKYLILFLVLVVVVPTCLGLVGTFLGIGGSIIGIFIAFLAPFFNSIINFFIH